MQRVLLTVITMVVWLTANARAADQGQPDVGNPSATSGLSSPEQPNGQTPGEGQTPQAQPSSSRPNSKPLPPLSGVERFTLGSQGGTRSYLLPSVEWTGSGDTNTEGVVGHTGLNYYSSYLWNLDLQKVKKTSQFNLGYAGGERLYTYPVTIGATGRSHYADSFQSLNLGEQASLRRWNFKIFNTFSYLPEPEFGFGGFGGLNSFGGGLGGAAFGDVPALEGSLTPNQTILTGRSRRLSNLATGELDFEASARSEFTVSGGYGTLQYIDPGFTDSSYWLLQAGYDHKLSPRDEVSLIYSHTLFTFHGLNHDLLDRGFELAYGRQITGRLALKVSAGPLVNNVAKPLGGSVTRSFLATDDSLEYRLAKNSLSVSFARMLTGGSGVLLGAESDVAQLTISHQFTRKLFASLGFGHAYNQSLTQVSTTAARSKYETYTGTVSINRELGEHLSMFISYSAERQISNNPVAFGGGNPGTVFLRQVGTVGINWHGRPRLLDVGGL